MKSTPSHFLLLGNGPYLNRGCEAIVRGTAAILRKEFGNDIHITVGTFCNWNELTRQAAEESDTNISHIALRPEKFDKAWWFQKVNQNFHTKLPNIYPVMDKSLKTADAALEIGGDNYSLYYSNPIKYLDLDRYIQRENVPVVLWGASVGPFEDDLKIKAKMLPHLQSLAGILVRESLSYDYLTHNLILNNLYQVADPAFVMEATPPDLTKLGFEIPNDAVGLNFSQLMAKYVTGDNKTWFQRCLEIITAIYNQTKSPIILIPHVISMHTQVCDYFFLNQLSKEANEKGVPVFCTGNNLSAAETKWIISKCAIFAGARTHSTIAGISSGVPTLSFAYSIKALGLNKTIFDSLDYCLKAKELTPEIVANRIVDMLSNAPAIRKQLQQKIPEIKKEAYHAGHLLKNILEKQAM
jgi:colanic acid/amylovoran biosynthesis protein